MATSQSNNALQSLSDTYQSLQNDLTSLIETRRTLSSQLTESTSVQSTLRPLPSTSKIFKLVGPVLLSQRKEEATMSVDARVKFIEKEIGRVEGLIGDVQAKMEGIKAEIINLQGQAEGGSGGQAIAA